MSDFVYVMLQLLPRSGPVNRQSVHECECKVTEWAIKERRDIGGSVMACSSARAHECRRGRVVIMPVRLDN